MIQFNLLQDKIMACYTQKTLITLPNMDENVGYVSLWECVILLE